MENEQSRPVNRRDDERATDTEQMRWLDDDNDVKQI